MADFEIKYKFLQTPDVHVLKVPGQYAIQAVGAFHRLSKTQIKRGIVEAVGLYRGGKQLLVWKNTIKITS